MVSKLSCAELPECTYKNPPLESLTLKVWGKTWESISLASLAQGFQIKAVQGPRFEKHCSKALPRKWLVLL